MSKILLFACLGSFVLSPVAQAQCVNVRFVSSGVGSLIQLLGTGISTSQLTAAAGYWATCPSYGTGFPRFTTDNVSADAQVKPPAVRKAVGPKTHRLPVMARYIRRLS